MIKPPSEMYIATISVIFNREASHPGIFVSRASILIAPVGGLMETLVQALVPPT